MDGVSNKFNKILNTEDYVILKNRKVYVSYDYIYYHRNIR